MEIITITAYRGLSVVSGSIDIRKLFEFIRGSVYRDKIRRLRETMETGDTAKADRMKKQLPYYTVTATYAMERLAYSLVTYQDIIILDCDDMPAEKIPGYRQLVNDCPDTLGDFISPRMHGLKIFVYLTGEEPEALRAELNALGTIDLPTLERYHHRMYALASQKYEELLHTKVDTSGSDLSRGFFASHDPEAFLSPERLENVKPLTVRVTLPTEEECKNKKRRKSTPQPPLLPTQENAAPIDLQVQLDFRKAMEYTRRKERLETGNRDNFFYCLGNQCYRRHITEEEAVSLTRSSFGDIPDFDLEQPLRNAYQYTSKTDREEKESHEPKICKMIRFMDEYYEIRRNIVKELIEFRRKPTTTDEKASSDFAILRAKDVNTFYINAQMKGISCSQNSLKALVDSDYAKPFNPFTHYFFSLPTWNGKTDYIAQLAQRVKTTDPDFFIDSLRHWLVGMVACAIDDKVQNQQLLLLHGGQGSGKSTFIRKLLPPELDTYYRCGMIIPENKDHLLQLSSSLIIDLDEFDTLPSWQMQSLKRLIVQGVVTERKVFDLQMNNFIRRASFIASTNDQHFLVDILENRRYLINTILSIDNSGPVNHQGIYAQALALYRQGYRYWYEKEEVTFLNKRNESFRQKDPVEENLFFYFRAAKGGEIQAKWYPASYLLSILSLNGRTQSNPQTQKTLVTVLEKNHFINRNGNYGVTEYKVVEYTPEEREANSTLPQIPKQGNFDL
ncbi:VapE domain-containing protein [Bacteroides faecis]|uniref:VapE domain-containing protein n=1 Tax=Bacteroides faecis TaxID=674529 RepID=UPI001D06C012|nr:VapE domain-containing protein [Bacteroides faecis]MCB6634978.1 virulence protein E [Bacteroides faecis]MCE8942095.1 virulence protein E [Bacteroides faecis]